MTTETQSGSNPFAEAEPWGTSAEKRLGEGNHRVRIIQADDATSSKENPQIDLRFENENGSIRRWEPYHETFLRKVVELFDCAGLERPKEGEFDPADHCRIRPEVLARLVGKEVGIVVRNEKSYKDPTKEYPEVQGYVPADKIEGSSSAASDGSADPLPGGGGGQSASGGQRERPF